MVTPPPRNDYVVVVLFAPVSVQMKPAGNIHRILAESAARGWNAPTP